jgi:hypothetical protein
VGGKTIHDEAEIRIHKEDRRYRRGELTGKRVYLAIHEVPKKWTMRIRKRTGSLYHWRFPDRQILLKRRIFL